jgi:dTDP-4-dehydrorhamnose 3,5-epimerase|tara:strand:- start:3391 stop:3921 length:531 start_codon:yes stop_codon:yes gene_type:complete
MKIKKTKFRDLVIVTSPVHKDKRGIFREIFKKSLLNKYKFIFNCTSTSKKNVLRGLHLQTKFKQGKYVSALKGEIYDVAVDLRKGSKTFGKTFSINLSDKNGISIYIPEGFAHGFVGLKKENIISYSCTQYRSKNHEQGIYWNDKDLDIKWPIKKPIVSLKDSKNLSLVNFIKKYG